MIYWLRYWCTRPCFDIKLFEIKSEVPLPIPRVGETMVFTGETPRAGIVARIDHQYQPESIDGEAAWFTGVYVRLEGE